MVPRAGIEPAQLLSQGILSPSCLPIPPPGQKTPQNLNYQKAWAGIEPAYRGFADPCLTT